jgi:hypothetical protein
MSIIARFGFASITSLALAGCTVRGGGAVPAAEVQAVAVAEEPYATGAVGVQSQQVSLQTWQEPPTVVQVEPEVYVVEQSPYPVYYVDRSYWQVRGGAWFRAGYYNEPWVRVDVHQVPRRIVHHRHDRYVHYRRRPGDIVYREPYRGARYDEHRHRGGYDRYPQHRDARPRGPVYDRSRYDDRDRRYTAPQQAPRPVVPRDARPPRPRAVPHQADPPRHISPRDDAERRREDERRNKRRGPLPPLKVPPPR